MCNCKNKIRDIEYHDICGICGDKYSNKGGKRKGAGRPKKAPTGTVSFRVELKQVEPVKALVNTYLTNLKNLKSV